MWIFAHLNEKYAKLWNAQNWHFFTGPRSWKTSMFLTFWKAFKMMKITTRWPQDIWNVKICSFGWEICKTVERPDWHFFRRFWVIKNFSFFDFLKRLLKRWKSPPVDHRTLVMLIYAHLGEKYEKMCPKMTIFCRSAVMKIFVLFYFLEILLKWWKSSPDDHKTLKCEYLLIWMRNMQNCEMPKIDIFSQVHSHKNFQLFGLYEKAFKMMKITASWPQDTWNKNMCSFGWEICENVKCLKMTIFRRSAIMKNFKFFEFLKRLLKLWKSLSDDHRTLEM